MATHRYVIDAQDDPSADAISKLHEIVKLAHHYNPNIYFEVFVHKAGGALGRLTPRPLFLSRLAPGRHPLPPRGG